MKHIFEKYKYDINIKLDNFEKYVRRQSLARFLARYELFKRILRIKGSIIECGVYYGGGLMAWAKLSANLEPYAIDRKIIGFDTFSGFPNLSDKDLISQYHDKLKVGGFNTGQIILEEIKECIEEFDKNRFLNQFNKIELIVGDACKTIPEYVERNPHLVVALLFLDFDLYEPTKVALEHFVKRIPKGGIIAFDELNNEFWKGETIAALEFFGNFNRLKIRKFEFDPNIAYVILD